MKKAFFLALTVLLLVSCEDMNHKKHATAHLIKNAVEDIDGNKYDAVKIGNQVWMAENLRTTRYADGTEIPLETNFNVVPPSKEKVLRFYPDGKSKNIETYGYLYNGPAVMHNATSSDENPSCVQGICPTGWHVPSKAEWEELINSVCSNNRFRCDGCGSCIAKALASPEGWKVSSNSCDVGNDSEKNNATHFSAAPAGSCYPVASSGFSESYEHVGSHAYFWTSSSTYLFYLSYNNAFVNYCSKDPVCGYSVRCVKD